MQKITPFLWYDNQAEEAANFYVSLFKNSKIGDITRYDKAAANAAGRPPGSVMVIDFQLEGQEFAAINGGPHFRFTEAVSFVVNCESPEEVDYFWEKLVEGGQESQCGWLKDKYGLSWQTVPTILGQLLKDKDAAKAKRVMEAMLKMKEDRHRSFEAKQRTCSSGGDAGRGGEVVDCSAVIPPAAYPSWFPAIGPRLIGKRENCVLQRRCD